MPKRFPKEFRDDVVQVARSGKFLTGYQKSKRLPRLSVETSLDAQRVSG